MKKIIISILSLCLMANAGMAVSAMEMNASVQTESVSSDINVSQDNDTLIITGEGVITELSVENPEKITKVIINEGITVIAKDVFSDFTSLKSATIPKSVSTIGENNFTGSEILLYVYNSSAAYVYCKFQNINYSIIPEEPVYSGKCGENVEWNYKDNLITFSGYGKMDAFFGFMDREGQPWFSYRDDVKAVKIEDNVENLGRYAFSDCESLTEIAFPKTIQTIDDNALARTNSLSRIYGYKTTAAQDYATNYNIQFISLDSDNLGDIDGDNTITSYDALLALQLTTSDNYTGVFAASSDLNNDNEVTSYDALLILQKTVENAE